MTFWGHEGKLAHPLRTVAQILGRANRKGHARRLSRRFARVGVDIPPGRLREMLDGMPVSEDEMTDVKFALIAMRLNREKRIAKLARIQRRYGHAIL
ncbi:hypothetical protein MBOU_59260 [Mycobacterium bourgelatii]|uniref:Uncharacterized protein n=1 Tax=Mycobacterium bourgelatii TaxID=1273442 RepID=A0A7I9YYS4_MYCBU|nr:hypothetical protein MBOU_59260 [Mycobacterium bourgelatii]